MNDNKFLIVWLQNGNVLEFEQVEYFKEYKNSITFTYFEISTQTEAEAEFMKSNIAGYALEI